MVVILNKQDKRNFCFQATGMTPLMYAVKDNRTSLVDRMIELGSDVGARNNVSPNPQQNITKKKIDSLM